MKKVSLLLILALSVISLSASEATVEGKSEQAGRKTTFVKNGFWDNWFIGAGIGTNVYAGEGFRDAKLMDTPALMGYGQVGKWINPIWGVRGKGTFNRVHSFSNTARSKAGRMERFNLATIEVDVMFDAINYWGKYDENRFYSIIPYAGIGYSHARSYKNYAKPVGRKYEHGVTVNGGLINQFRITNKLAAQVELSATLLKDDHDKKVYNKRAYDVLLQGQVGVVYKLGAKKTNFAEAKLMDQARIDELNDKINELQKENAELSKRPKSCPECPEVQPQVVEQVVKGINGNAVFFRLGSDVIDQNQEGNIYTVGKYLQDNPNAKVSVVGYADKQTGSAAINQRLSERRAKKVADALVNQYKINRNRLDVQWKGDKVQPYSKNAWNRVVIIVEE